MQDIVDIFNSPYSTANGERDKDFICHSLDQPSNNIAPIRTGGDIEKAKFVGTVFRVKSGIVDRVSRISKVNEIDPFYNATVLDVKTGNNATCQHRTRIQALACVAIMFGRPRIPVRVPTLPVMSRYFS